MLDEAEKRIVLKESGHPQALSSCSVAGLGTACHSRASPALSIVGRTKHLLKAAQIFS